jgi:DNA gyrase subunit A
MDNNTIDNTFDKVQEVDLKKTMETSYVNYAMSVIVARALPDARDGLKPVQRRILHAMNELGNDPDKPHRKCARIVGDTMGKYHPHGDSSIYGALVYLAQEWSTHYPLIDGHGNFGSVDGDGAAAMRYTEARLSKISVQMLADIEKETVDFVPNFDETEKEPLVLPARYPNLLVNGTTGIAVGMATNIPPHNMTESINAVIKLIEDKQAGVETTIEDLMAIIKGPDFPTGATILGTRGINEAYRTGRGKIRVRAVTDIEPMANGKNRIVVTELPYLVNKAKLVELIGQLSREKKIDGITDIRDESNREGMRVCIELRKDVNPQVILNQLYKHTQLQDTFGVIMLALVNNEPKVLNLHELLTVYLDHQEEVVTRRTKYDLRKAEERAHIVKGLLIALDNIDEVIRIIRGSKNVNIAKEELITRFGLDDVQAQAIVDMRLRALTGLEREKLEQEYAELMKKIDEFKAILGDEKLLLGVIKDEISVIRDKFGDERKTQIGLDVDDFIDEDLIPDENEVIAKTRLGYIKRMAPDNFQSQNRGGKGIKGMQTIDNDNVESMFTCTTHQTILFFTNKGRVYKLKAYEIPESGRTSRGTAMVNLMQLMPEEKIVAMLPVKTIDNDNHIIFVTKKGIIKKTALSDYSNILKKGIIAINLREDDDIVDVKLSNGNNDILLVTKKGMCTRFNEEELRVLGRGATGVTAMKLADDDEIISMNLDSDGSYLLIASEKGYGKLTDLKEFDTHHRGGKGLRCYKIAEKTGDVMGVIATELNEEILMITNDGVMIRIRVSDISIIGRNTSGVKLINIKNSDKYVSSISKVDTEEDLEGSDEAVTEDTEGQDTNTEGSEENA